MKGKNRRGSYFYVIDAFIASILILATIIVLFSRFISQQSSTQAFYTAEDFLTTMEHTPVVTIDNPRIGSWIADGSIPNPQISTIEQLAYFTYTDQLPPAPARDNAKKLAEIVAASAPARVGLNITVNGQVLYVAQRNAGPMASANTKLSAKRIVVLKSSPDQIHAPYLIEVQTWQ